MTVSFAVMAHPRRREWAEELCAELPGCELVLDRKNNIWDTGRRALLAADPAADFHCVAQDDALLCRDFASHVERVAAATDGDRPIGLYVGTVRPYQEKVVPAVKRARQLGIPWLEMPGPWWGVAIALPTDHIPEVVAAGDGMPPTVKAYDRRVAACYVARNIDCLYTVPSLADHRPQAENRSLVRGRHGNRRAHYFASDTDLSAIDWTTKPLRLDTPVTYRSVNTGRCRTVQVGTAAARSMDRNPNWIEEAPDADIPLAA